MDCFNYHNDRVAHIPVLDLLPERAGPRAIYVDRY